MLGSNSYEIGLKQTAWNDRLALNLAAFLNRFKNLQRDVSRTDPVLGSVQQTANTADVTIRGLEAEISARLAGGFSVNANAGYQHSKFDKIVYDLSGNGTVGPEDYALKLPLLAPWSYGVSASYAHALANQGVMSGRVSFNHRDMVFYTDSNVGYLNPINNIDADITYAFPKWLTVSVYGKNLTNRVFYGADVPLPFTPHETHSPLSKGRVIGAEFRLTVN